MRVFLVICLAAAALAAPKKSEGLSAPTEEELIAADIMEPPSTLKQRMDKGVMGMRRMFGMKGHHEEEDPPLPPPPPQVIVVYPAYPIRPQYNYAGSYSSPTSYSGGGGSYGGGGYGDSGAQLGPSFPSVNVLNGLGGMGGLGNLGPAGVGMLGPNINGPMGFGR